MSDLLKIEDVSILEENKDDFKETVLERKNLTNTFTIASIEKHLVTLNTMKKEGEAQLGLSKATADNVLKNNSFLKKMSEEDQNAALMYRENVMSAKEIEPQLAEVNEEIKKHEGYLDMVYKKFGFVKVDPGVIIEESVKLKE